MMFARPELLWLLLVPALVLMWAWHWRGAAVAMPLDHGRREPSRWSWLPVMAGLAPALLLALAVVLIAEPQRLAVPVQRRVPTNIEFCLDVSGSMTARFGGDGSRYDAAMAALTGFTTARPGDSFGLTIFGSDVLRWTPITSDLDALRRATPWLRPEQLPHHFGGTMIAKGLRSCIGTLARQGAVDADRMIVLLTDGQSGDLDPRTAGDLVEELRRRGITVFTVQIGEQAQAEVFTISEGSGGRVFNAGDPEGLRQCFAHIDRLKPVLLKPEAPRPVDHSTPWLLSAVGVLVLHLLLRLGARWTPW